MVYCLHWSVTQNTILGITYPSQRYEPVFHVKRPSGHCVLIMKGDKTFIDVKSGEKKKLTVKYLA